MLPERRREMLAGANCPGMWHNQSIHLKLRPTCIYLTPRSSSRSTEIHRNGVFLGDTVFAWPPQTLFRSWTMNLQNNYTHFWTFIPKFLACWNPILPFLVLLLVTSKETSIRLSWCEYTSILVFSRCNIVLKLFLLSVINKYYVSCADQKNKKGKLRLFFFIISRTSCHMRLPINSNHIHLKYRKSLKMVRISMVLMKTLSASDNVSCIGWIFLECKPRQHRNQNSIVLDSLAEAYYICPHNW